MRNDELADAGSTELADHTPSEDVRRTVRRAAAAIGALAAIDPSGLDAAACRELLEGIEQARRMVDGAAIQAAASIERANPFRGQGFFSARTVLKHMLQLSGAEAFRRLQSARLQDRLPDWADAERSGVVGVAQTELMARVAANPRVPGAVLQRDQAMLLDDAISLAFDEFDRNVRMWEALADPEGDLARHERQIARRHVTIRPCPEGGWTLTGSLPELGGTEFMEIFSWFVAAEWETDWAEARARLGDEASTAGMLRTEPQRRADALLAMARAAASASPDAKRPTATVNIHMDVESLEAHLRGELPDPRRYRDIVCRTQSGRRLHPDEVVNTALTDHVRRVVYDSTGTVIDLGRRSRLFRGAAREAVMLLATQCCWIGCDRPVAWCDADHSLSWRAVGATVPRNGGPLCRGHNLLKERGFRVVRDSGGAWHVFDPDGNEVT
ncbi:MAG: DUF222 domain-containing protein [Ilumatobacteraceae bacterium]